MPHERRPSIVSALTSVAAAVIVLAGLKAAAPIVVPFALALFLAILASRPVHWMHGHRVPRVLAVLMTIAAIVGAMTLVATLSAASLSNFAERFPTYQTQLQDRWSLGLVMLEEFLGRVGLTEGYQNLRDQLQLREILSTAASMAANTLLQFGNVFLKAVLVALTVAFMLFESFDLTAKLRVLLRQSPETWSKLGDFVRSVENYIAIKTVTSMLTGVAVCLWLLILGVDYAIFWGLLAFVLNYVPNIGSVAAAVPAVLIALMQHGPGIAVVAAAGYLAINLTVGSIIEPNLLGRSVGLSPLVAFTSLVFWGFLLGPVGMLLSPPLTITVKFALEHYPETRWLAILLGSAKNLDSPAS